MTGARLIAALQILIGLVLTNLVVILGPVYLLAGAGFLLVGALLILVWPSSRAGQTCTLAGALALGGWAIFVVFSFQLHPPLLYLVVPLVAASILMALYQPRLVAHEQPAE